MKISVLQVLAATLVFGLASCGGQKEQKGPVTLFPTCSLDDVKPASELSQMISASRVVRLETNDSCLIGGREQKVLKRAGTYYVRSFNDVLLFDNDGRFQRKLSKMGGGNDEYAVMRDFDVAQRASGNEIWVASNKEISRYDAGTLDFVGKIVSDDYINKFCYVNDSTILTVTPGEQTLRVLTLDGTVRKSILDKDEVNTDLQAVQFRKVGDVMAYKISLTDEVMAYSPSGDEFFSAYIIPMSEDLLSSEANREYCEKYGYMNQVEKVAESFIRLSSYQAYGDSYILVTAHPGGKFRFTYGTKDTQSLSWEVSADDIRIGDSLTINGMRPLQTIIACDSDNGFLCMVPSEFIEGANEDDNPVLLELVFGN